MKRIISATLATLTIAMSAFVFSSCGKKYECDFCGEEKKCIERTVWGETFYLCNDCIGEFNE